MPNGWTLVRVGEVVALNPKNNAAEQTQAGFSPMHLLGTRFRSSVGFEPRLWLEIRKSYTHFADGDVLLAKITPCFENGKAGLVANMPNGIGAGSSEYFVCRPKAGALDAKYLLAHFKTDAFLKGGAVRMTGSVGHKRVPKEHLLSSELPLAPIGEQKRIADKLDTVLARVDACRNQLDRVPSILRRFRQSVLSAACSGRLTEEWRATNPTKADTTQLIQALHYAHESAGGHKTGNAAAPTEDVHDLSADLFPPEWALVTLRDLVLPDRSITYGILKPGPELEDGVPYVRVADFPGEKLNLSTIRKTSPKMDDEFKRSRLRPGDLLLSIRGTVGRLIVIPKALDGANITQDSARLSVQPAVNRDYVLWYLRSEVAQSRMKRATKGVAVRGINIGDVRALQVPMPSRGEQDEIVRRVESLFAWADRLEARHATAGAHVKRLTPALLAKAFRGELVSPDSGGAELGPIEGARSTRPVAA